LPESTLVTAAREGVVVYIVSEFSEHGLNATLYDKANLIHVLHSDNTIGEYAHLRHNGNLVSIGQKVQRGDPLGYSGNTGFTNAPHLHFSVMQLYDIQNHKMETLPIKFRTKENPASELQEGKSYERY
jgi:murein DD-endopeptidase MepM/ murein hydrolase activator NlpD